MPEYMWLWLCCLYVTAFTFKKKDVEGDCTGSMPCQQMPSYNRRQFNNCGTAAVSAEQGFHPGVMHMHHASTCMYPTWQHSAFSKLTLVF